MTKNNKNWCFKVILRQWGPQVDRISTQLQLHWSAKPLFGAREWWCGVFHWLEWLMVKWIGVMNIAIELMKNFLFFVKNDEWMMMLDENEWFFVLVFDLVKEDCCWRRSVMVFDEPNGKRIFFDVQDVCFESDGVDVGDVQQRCLKDLMCE